MQPPWRPLSDVGDDRHRGERERVDGAQQREHEMQRIGAILHEQARNQRSGRESGDRRDASYEASQTWMVWRLQIKQPGAERARGEPGPQALQHPRREQHPHASCGDEGDHTDYLNHQGEQHHRSSSQVIGESPGSQQRGQQRQGIHPEDCGQGERGEMPHRFIDHIERRGGAGRE